MEAIEDERIKVNGRPTFADYRLKNGDNFSHKTTRAEPPVYRTYPTHIHEDEDFLVVDKPPSLPVHECGAYFHNSLTRLLKLKRGGEDLLPPHRLDRLTSGVLVLAKNAGAAIRVGKSIESGQAEKIYLARVEGSMQSKVLEVNMKCVTKETWRWGVCALDDPEGKPSRTTFECISYSAADDTTLARCRIHTGRTHQIRVHLKYLGHPIINDVDYGGRYVGNFYERYVLFYFLENASNTLLEKRSRVALEPDEDICILKTDGFSLSDKPREIFPHAKSYTIESERFKSSDPYWACPALAFPPVSSQPQLNLKGSSA